MKKISKIMNNVHVLVAIAIGVLCAGFIFISCGKGPQLKAQDPNAGQFALDFTVCPNPTFCQLNFESDSFLDPKYQIGNKEVTVEAWIKPKSTSTSTVISRSDGNRGIKMTIDGIGGNTTQVTPIFQINRLVTNPVTKGTSTVSYTVSSSNVLVNVWNHIAALIVDADHSAHHPAVTCGGGESQSPHLDIFVNGTITTCATSRGKTVLIDGTNVPDNAIPLGFAHEPVPEFKQANALFNGILDEVRIWTTDRTDLIAMCKDTELFFNSGDCGQLKDSLIGYLRFNEGSGHTASDARGLGTGGLEYNDPNVAGNFPSWDTGWTTDTPF